jgi:hypothetical protein
MRNLKLWTTGALFGVLALVLLAVPHFSTQAQVPSANPPFNADLGVLLTNTARAAGTVNSVAQINLDKLGVICSYNATATPSFPQITLAIQNLDSASGNWYTIATSTISSPNINVPIVVMDHYGMQTSSLPTGVAGASGVLLSRQWRVQQVTTGIGSTTGTVGCVLVK